MKTVKIQVPEWYPGYAVVPYYAPYYYPWYGYYVWPYSAIPSLFNVTLGKSNCAVLGCIEMCKC